MGRKPKVELSEEEKLERAKNWRKRTVKYTEATTKISEVERVVLANDKFDDVTVWAMQAYCIDPNPIMFYKATHKIKDSDTIANIAKKANTFISSPSMQAAIKAMKKDIASKSFIPSSIRRRVMLEKEVIQMDDMVGTNGDLPSIDRDAAIKKLEKAVHMNPDDLDALKLLISTNQWNKQEGEQEDDVYAKLTHFYLPYTCSKCERRNTKLCSGCSIEKEEEGLLTEEELKLAESLKQQNS